MPTDRPVDTPKSLRALAARLSPEPGVFAYRDGDLKLIVETLHRAADRLEAPSNAADLVQAIDAARRAGAEEMRAACLDLSRGCQHDLGFDREHGPIGCALDAEGRGGCMCAGLYAAIRALPLPGDQP